MSKDVLKFGLDTKEYVLMENEEVKFKREAFLRGEE